MFQDDKMIPVLTVVILMVAVGTVLQNGTGLSRWLGPAEPAIVLNDDTVSAPAEALLRIDVLANDENVTDAARDELTIVRAPACGRLFVHEAVIEYLPYRGCVGRQTIRYSVPGAKQESAAVTVNIRLPGTPAEQPEEERVATAAQIGPAGSAGAVPKRPVSATASPSRAGAAGQASAGAVPSRPVSASASPSRAGTAGQPPAAGVAATPRSAPPATTTGPVPGMTVAIAQQAAAATPPADVPAVPQPALQQPSTARLAARQPRSPAVAGTLAMLDPTAPERAVAQPAEPRPAQAPATAQNAGQNAAQNAAVPPQVAVAVPPLAGGQAGADAVPVNSPGRASPPARDSATSGVAAGSPGVGEVVLAATAAPAAETDAAPVAAVPAAPVAAEPAADSGTELATGPAEPGTEAAAGHAVEPQPGVEAPAITMASLDGAAAAGRPPAILPDRAIAMPDSAPTTPVRADRVAAQAPRGAMRATIVPEAGAALAFVSEAPPPRPGPPPAGEGGVALALGPSVDADPLRSPPRAGTGMAPSGAEFLVAIIGPAEPAVAPPAAPEVLGASGPPAVAGTGLPGSGLPAIGDRQGGTFAPGPLPRLASNDTGLGPALAFVPVEEVVPPIPPRAPRGHRSGDVRIARLEPAETGAPAVSDSGPSALAPAGAGTFGADGTGTDRTGTVRRAPDPSCTTPPAMTLELLSAAETVVSVVAPCHASSMAELSYSGIRLAVPLDAQGRGSVTMLGFEPSTPTLLTFDDGRTLDFDVPFRDIERVSRVALVWDAPVQFELNAVPQGSDPGVTAVTPESPSSFEEVRRTGGGYLDTYRSVGGAGQNVQVFSWWHRRGESPGIVRLLVDFVSRDRDRMPGTCGNGPKASPQFLVLRSDFGRPERPVTRRLAAIDCAEIASNGRDRLISGAIDDLVITRR